MLDTQYTYLVNKERVRGRGSEARNAGPWPGLLATYGRHTQNISGPRERVSGGHTSHTTCPSLRSLWCGDLPAPMSTSPANSQGPAAPLRHRAAPGDRPRGGTHTGPGGELGTVGQACALEVGHGSAWTPHPWAGVKRAPLALRRAQGSHGILLKCGPYLGPWRGLRCCVSNELPGDGVGPGAGLLS